MAHESMHKKNSKKLSHARTQTRNERYGSESSLPMNLSQRYFHLIEKGQS